MKHGIITPTSQLQLFAKQSDFHLILPHLFKNNPKYVEFYKWRAKEGDHVVLDNSIFELEHSFDFHQMLEMAEDVGVTEMSAPEVLKDREASKRVRDEFLTHHSMSGSKVKILAVAQGQNFVDIIDSYFELLNIVEIETLGLPFDIDEEIPYISDGIKSLTLRRVLNRWALVEAIDLLAVQQAKRLKPTHLMGLADAIELTKYKPYAWIRSNDSSSAFVHGINGIRYTDRGLPGEKISMKLDFEGYQKLTTKQIEDVNFNIKKIQSWI